MTHNNTDKKET